MDSTLVIKAKYGDTLRRFNVQVNENRCLDIDMAGLKARIFGLFGLSDDADVSLTYIDEDGDIVSLVDDDDLNDILCQKLKFLRIFVQLKNDDKFGKYQARSSGSSTPIRSPRPPNPSPAINTGVTEMLRAVPEPLRETLSQLSQDLASKAACKHPVLADLVDSFSKLGQSYLDLAKQDRSGASSSSQAVASEIPSAPSADAVPNRDCSEQVLPGSDSTGKSSHEVNTREVKTGTRVQWDPVTVPVDLNQCPPFDSNPSAWTPVTIAASAPGGSTTAGGKDSDQPFPNPALFGANPGLHYPVRPLHPVGMVTMGNASVTHPAPLPRPRPFKRNNCDNDPASGIFHRGVQCDVCGVLPIVGSRYKSEVKEDYDLCAFCFNARGNETDYIKIDKPVSHPSPRGLKGLHNTIKMRHPRFGCHPRASLISRHSEARRARHKMDSRFIVDVNVLDGTIMAPSTPFTKIWKMQNNGSVAWPRGTKLVWIGGDKFSNTESTDLEISAYGVPVDGELDIAVDFIAPELPGRYISYWRMALPSGTKFGQRVWVLIQVDDSSKDAICAGLQELNLNVHPDSDGSKVPEALDMNAIPAGDVGIVGPSSGTSDFEPIKPVVGENPQFDLELNFPINDILLVGDDVSDHTAPQSSSVPYPVVDVCEAASVKFSDSNASKILPSVSYPVVDTSETVPIKFSNSNAPKVPESAPYPVLITSEEAPVKFSNSNAPKVPESAPYPVVITSEEAPVKFSNSNALKIPESTPYPVVVTSEAATSDWPAELPALNASSSSKDGSIDDAVERFLLKELEEMGFKQIDLNKEVLRMNDYDLDRSVDDLCGVSEWDPMLQELEEMGFNDRETNRKLLKKNNGSIKRVVMDLVVGEKA